MIMSQITNIGSAWRYFNQNLGLQLNKISNLFSQEGIQEEGDPNKGKIGLKSKMVKDEILGPEAKMEISWEKVDPTQYHHGLKVKETIRMFSSIGVVANKKETHWHLSHEMTYWIGNREQIVRQRYYPTIIVHAIVFCELSHRVFEVHAVSMATSYAKYEQPFLDTIFSLQCHG